MLHPASGTGTFVKTTAKIIRLARHGCTNRPFYHIVVTEKSEPVGVPVIEQLGTFDPYPNEHNEKLVALNLERIIHWLGNGAEVSKPVGKLFGLAGLTPIHPMTYMEAWRTRIRAKEIEIKEVQPSNAEEFNE